MNKISNLVESNSLLTLAGEIVFTGDSVELVPSELMEKLLCLNDKEIFDNLFKDMINDNIEMRIWEAESK
jgi:hypothetical protein